MPTRRRELMPLPVARGLLRGLGVLLILLLLLVVWVGVRGWLAKGHLETGQALVAKLEQQARVGQSAGGQRDLTRLQGETAAARDLTGDPGWALATTLPVLGDDFAAVRAVARSVDAVASNALPPLLEVSTSLSPSRLKPKDGRIDLAPLIAARPLLRRADVALRSARAPISAYVGPAAQAELVGPVRRAVLSLDASLRRVSKETATGSRAADLLPPMLGNDGKRRYLVLFQNLSEARSLGGLVGALSVVEADRGRLTLTKQGTASTVPLFDQPVRRIEGATFYRPAPARFFQNITQPIDFTVSGPLAREMWQRRIGQKLDGVVAMDPVALSYILKGTGPLKLASETLTSGNAVALLLNRVYLDTADPEAQNAFFATTASAVFSKLLSGGGNPAQILTGLARAAGERRLLVWSANGTEQARLAGTVLEGRLPTREVDYPTIGLFLNDGTGSKMSYYLRRSTVVADTCRSDGLRGTRVLTNLTSTAPRTGLSLSVTGPGTLGARRYITRTLLYLVGPVDGALGAVTVDGKKRAVNMQLIGQRPVASVQVDLKPGASAKISVDMVGPALPGRTRLRTTPGVAPSKDTIQRSSCPGRR